MFDYFLLFNQYYNISTGNLGIFSSNNQGRIESDLPYDKSKGSIVTMGCSFTHGDSIQENETLAYKLQKITNRKTYNRGFSGTGIQHVLLQLQTLDFLNDEDRKVSPLPEYFIYVFISDHMRRLYIDYFDLNGNRKYIKYKKDINNKLILNHWDKIEFGDYIKVTFLAKKFNDLIYRLKSNDELFDFFKLHLIESKKIIDKKYNNAKFVVIVYNPELDTHSFRPFRTERWNELEAEGIQVIRFDKKEYDFLANEEFIASDNVHPGRKAWDVLVPEIIKQLNLQKN